MPSETSFIPRLLERAAVLERMKVRGLSLDWRREFGLADLDACCGRMEKSLPDAAVPDKEAQRELIGNPAFAAYLAALLALLPEEPERRPEPAPAYGARRYSPPRSEAPPSRRAVLLGRLYALLPVCREAGRTVTGYPVELLADALALDDVDGRKRLVLLENPSLLGAEGDRQAVPCGFRACPGLPLELSPEQAALLREPCAASRHLFASSPFGEVWELLEASPALLEIARLFHRLGVDEALGLAEYRAMAGDAGECLASLLSLSERMGPPALGRFAAFWQKGGCKLRELRTMERWASAHPGQDWDGLLANYGGYVNLLYGRRFRRIDLSRTEDYQEAVLIYAIVNRKKHFIRLVDEHAETFLDLPRSSVLFWEEFYRDHFNVNDLSAEDLAGCARVMKADFRHNALAPGRRYTFQEVAALHKASGKSFALYHALASDSTDYRLRVFRQAVKGDILSGVPDGEIGALAAALDQKPLYDWLERDLGHIAGLTAGDAARLLPHLDELRHLLPGIRTRTDALLALRHRDVLARYGGIGELKADILRIDADWKSLVGAMGLRPEFVEAHRGSILPFLCRNGAEIAVEYADALDDRQREAFFRVVKAELMGKLDKLKYFEGDLQRELDSPLTVPVKTGWRRNLAVGKDGLEVREHDGFFETMLLGVQPQRTCMSYIDGQYRECLLSAFDSNKKILYARLGGKIVGRAFLRLTKGRLAGSRAHDGFTFADLEAPGRGGEDVRRERVTLFLERPYISGVGPETRSRVERMLIRLAVQKADELDVALVLSLDYGDSCGSGFAKTRYDIYISKSKAGRQYLDSLDGEATATREGSYKANTFLVRDLGAFPRACAG